MAAPNIVQSPMTIAALIAAGVGKQQISLPIALAGIAGTANVHKIVPGFKGRIIALDFSIQVVVTTAAKAASLNMDVDGVDVTGGVLALTSANCTPAGNRVAGSAVTALNSFTATSVLTLKASGVTAFAEGSGVAMLTVYNDDTLDAIAKSLNLFSS